MSESDFLERIKYNGKLPLKKKIPNDLDMQGYLRIALIDDNEDLIPNLKRYYDNLYPIQITLDRLQREIFRKRRFLEDYDIIFVDTRYDNKKSGNEKKYAIDLLDEYMAMSKQAKDGIKEKYMILLNPDDMEREESEASYVSTDLLRSDRRIHTRARQLNYSEYGIGLGTKVEKMIKFVEKKAEEKKIYLYKKPEMTLDEWNSYTKWLISKVREKVEILRAYNLNDEEYNKSVSRVESMINSAEEKLMSQNGEFRDINSAKEFIDNSILKQITDESKGIFLYGLHINNLEISREVHNLNQIFLMAKYKFMENKVQETPDKDGEER